MNADGIIGANQDILGYNLYAYVSNNPISFDDSDGNSAAVLGGGIGIGGFIILGYGISKAISLLFEGTKQAINTVSNVVQDVVRNISKPSKKNDDGLNNHNVYVLRDHQTHAVEYVGRTQKLERRKYEHKQNVFRANLDFDSVAINVSEFTARGLE